MATTIGRHFPLTIEQAAWLREAAYEHHVKQAEIVRYAIDAVRADMEGRPRPPSPISVRGEVPSLGGSLADGPDLAGRLLDERRREERA